ncbi:MAG: ABC transporter, partial [Proteobacteria bacterium]|nr:ABC transporter [Pseudomonadota bacterium]
MPERNNNNSSHGERPKSSNIRPLRQALPFLKPYTGQLLLAFACLTIAAMAALGMPVAIRYVIDYGFSDEAIESINLYFLALLLLSLIFAVFASLRHYFVMWIGERFVADIRSRVYSHVIRMSPTFFEVTGTGEVLSRLTTDTTVCSLLSGRVSR